MKSVGILLILVVLGFGAFFAFKSGPSGTPDQVELQGALGATEDPESANHESGEIQGSGAVGDSVSAHGVDPQVEGTAGQRKEVEVSFQGLVRDEAGLAIEGAVISWSPLTLAEPGLRYSSLSYEEWLAASILTTSDSEGRFRLGAAAADAAGIVWVTAAGYRAQSMRTESGKSDLDVILSAGTPWSVSVLGLPVEYKARVDLRGQVDHLLSASERDDLFDETLLLRRFEVGAEALAFGASESFLLQAQSESQQSPLAGPFFEPEIKLNLAPTCEVLGQVTGFDGKVPALVVAYHEVDSFTADVLGSLLVRANGEIVPRRLPRIATGSYRFQLEGQLIPTSIQRFPASQVGEQLRLEFAVDAGVKLNLRFVDQAGAPIEGVTARPYWNRADVFGEELMASSFNSGADGHLAFTMDTDAIVSLACFRDGYAYQEVGPFVVNDWVDQVLEIVMPPAGFLTGRVTFQGQPVSDFEVVYYAGSGWGAYSPETIQDSEDGTFELLDVPVGEYEGFVTSPGLAQSEPQTFEVRAGEATEVQFELGVGGLGVGRVLDALSREPLQGVLVSRPARSTYGRIGSILDGTIVTDVDGRYEVPGLIGASNSVGFYLDGYSYSEASATQDQKGEYDFGVALIAPAQPYIGHVIPPAGIDVTAIQYEVSNAFFAGPAFLNSDGTFVSEAATPGFAAIEFGLPSGEIFEQTYLLTGAGPWEETFDLSGTARLRLWLQDTSGLPEGWSLSEALFVICRVDDAFVQRSERTSIGVDLDAKDGQLTIGLIPGTYSVVLYAAPRLLPVAYAQVEARANEITDVALSLTGTLRAVRVVDAEGAPVVGETVKVCGAGPNGVLGSDETDETGLVVLGVFEDGPVALHVGGYSSRQLDLQLDALGTPAKPTQVVFDPQGRVTLHVHDRGSSLDGVGLVIEAGATGLPIVWTTVGEGGRVTLTGITPGPIRVMTTAAGLWPEVQSTQVLDVASTQEVEFRRLGSAEVHVVDLFGKPVANAAVNVFSSEYGVDVAAWVSAGLVQAADGMVTDSDGVVRIAGLPNGTYQLDVGGVGLEFVVPALGVGVVTLSL